MTHMPTGQARSDLRLVLPDLGLVNFPRDAAAFPELELIDLSDNQMQTIPNRVNIFTVFASHHLLVCFCRTITFPSGRGWAGCGRVGGLQMQRLTSLDLHNNRLLKVSVDDNQVTLSGTSQN